MGIGDPDAQQLHAAGPPVGAIALKLVEAIVGGGAGHERLSVEVRVSFHGGALLLGMQWISGAHAESGEEPGSLCGCTGCTDLEHGGPERWKRERGCNIC